MSSLFEHPGFMPYENGFFEVIHADWPMYPTGHGWQPALETLGNFPEGTVFQSIDDIDQCILFVAVGLSRASDPFDEDCFHVALWHEDLLELHERGFVSGVKAESEYERDLSQYERFKDACYEKNGKFYKLSPEPPDPTDYDEDEDYKPFVVIDSGGLQVTAEGYRALTDFDPSRPLDLDGVLTERVAPLIAIARYDTAVREATIIIESRLRRILNTDAFGQNLVNVYYALLCDRQGGRSMAFLKAFRAELRTMFKFVRNEYAHNLRDISPKQCYAILKRASKVLEMIEDVERIDGESS